ncbi:MAG: Imm1 family immunity protein [Paracoccaceae bacterium]
MIEVTVNGEEHQFDDANACDRLLASVSQQEDLEIWASVDQQSRLCGLLNSQGGWLMFLRHAEDVGSRSRNLQREVCDGGFEEYILGNGQADSYPKSWAFDRPVIFAAISAFARTGERPTTVDWQDSEV